MAVPRGVFHAGSFLDVGDGGGGRQWWRGGGERCRVAAAAEAQTFLMVLCVKVQFMVCPLLAGGDGIHCGGLRGVLAQLSGG